MNIKANGGIMCLDMIEYNDRLCMFNIVLDLKMVIYSILHFNSTILFSVAEQVARHSYVHT